MSLTEANEVILKNAKDWKRSIRVVWSDCQYQNRKSSGFDPSILRRSGIVGAADKVVLNSKKQCSGSMTYWCGSGYGSMTFWCGSGSADPCLWLMNPEKDPAIFVTDLQDARKKWKTNLKNSFSAHYILKVIYTIFLKIKSPKEVTIQ